LVLTERDAELDDNKPRVTGRIITTLEKAKEVRPLVEKCVTIACRSLPHAEAASEFATDASHNSAEWRSWRASDRWRKWNQTMSSVVAARRRVLELLGDKQAVRVLFETIAPRYSDRTGGYTRVVRLAKPRLGDAGTRAVLEFVGVRDRATQRSVAPRFDTAAEAKKSERPAAKEKPEATEDEGAEE
jgi:large subunit ribosomal protein L17